jgi:hypothetical protein
MGRKEKMYKAKLVKHVCKEMQLTDENGKVVFKASVDVAVDDYMNNIPTLSEQMQETEKKINTVRATANAEGTDVITMAQTLGELSKPMTKCIDSYLITIFGAMKTNELLKACNFRHLDAYCAVVPFVNECIVPEINNEMDKNLARIENIMK